MGAQARCGILPTHTLAPISSPTPPPAPTAPPGVHGCEHWCSADARAWSSKCNFPLCNGCSVCPSSLAEDASKTSDVNNAEDDWGRRRRRDRRRRERRRTPAPVTWTEGGEVLSGISGTWDDAET